MEVGGDDVLLGVTHASCVMVVYYNYDGKGRISLTSPPLLLTVAASCVIVVYYNYDGKGRIRWRHVAC